MRGRHGAAAYTPTAQVIWPEPEASASSSASLITRTRGCVRGEGADCNAIPTRHHLHTTSSWFSIPAVRRFATLTG